MLFDKIYYKKKKRDDNFIFHYVIKWLLIILIVSVFFMIVNNIFYNTLENEINTDIYNNPTTPSDMITVNSANNNLNEINDIITTKPINEVIENSITDKPIEAFKELPTNVKSLNILPSINYSPNNNKVFEDLQEVFKNIDKIPITNQVDFNLNL